MAGALLSTALTSKTYSGDADEPVAATSTTLIPASKREQSLGLQYVETPLSPVTVPSLPHKITDGNVDKVEQRWNTVRPIDRCSPIKTSYQLTYSALFGSSVLAILLVTSERYRIYRWESNALVLLTVANLIAGFCYSQMDEDLFEKVFDPSGVRYANWFLTIPLVLAAATIFASQSTSVVKSKDFVTWIVLVELWLWLRYLAETSSSTSNKTLYGLLSLVPLAVLTVFMVRKLCIDERSSLVVYAFLALLLFYTLSLWLPTKLKNISYNMLDFVLYVGLIVVVAFRAAFNSPYAEPGTAKPILSE